MKKDFIGNNQYSGLSLEDRFWQKVDKREDGECWEWIGCRHWQWKYGNFSFNGKYIAAHRFSWMLHYGEIPDGMCVCHKCDNPPCINPNHLFLGTIADNNLDKKLKGHQSDNIGEHNNRAKLTNLDVLKIRELHSSGKYSGAKLGRMFGVGKEEIYGIIHRRRWSHI